MDLCQYKHSLGVPGEGAHARRIGAFAANDLIGTVAAAAVISVISNWSFIIILIILLLIGTILHWAFCVPTAGMLMINDFLGIEASANTQ